MQSFASAPKAVAPNIMFDRRVVRGNTFAVSMIPQQESATSQRQRETTQRRRLARTRPTTRRTKTPEPVAGRRHMDIQTESYLVELTACHVEFEAETQTDPALDRPSSPLFIPSSCGVDAITQIEEGDLFDFDVECEPVLQVLVGKALELGLMEALAEEETAALKRQQGDFEERRAAEVLEVERLKACEERRRQEAERRKRLQDAQRELELRTARRVASRAFAVAYLADLKGRALSVLADSGFFADGTELAVETRFMPQLMRSVSERLAEMWSADRCAAGILSEAVRSRMEAHSFALRREEERWQREFREKEEQVMREAEAQKAEKARREAEEEREAERIEAEENAGGEVDGKAERVVGREAEEAKSSGGIAEGEDNEAQAAIAVEARAADCLFVEELGDEGRSATLSDGTTAPVCEEKIEDLLRTFASVPAGHKIAASLEPLEASTGIRRLVDFSLKNVEGGDESQTE